MEVLDFFPDGIIKFEICYNLIQFALSNAYFSCRKNFNCMTRVLLKFLEAPPESDFYEVFLYERHKYNITIKY